MQKNSNFCLVLKEFGTTNAFWMKQTHLLLITDHFNNKKQFPELFFALNGNNPFTTIFVSMKISLTEETHLQYCILSSEVSQ
jgi:hypothetical protein